MSEKEQVERFEKELNNLINRYRLEYQITIASVVGVLAVKQFQIIHEHLDDNE